MLKDKREVSNKKLARKSFLDKESKKRNYANSINNNDYSTFDISSE